jgi:hypothetical protein
MIYIHDLLIKSPESMAMSGKADVASSKHRYLALTMGERVAGLFEIKKTYQRPEQQLNRGLYTPPQIPVESARLRRT